MSIHRLTAGAGYRYLTRTTASGDAARSPEQSLTAYYTATGTPPGRWHGTGLAGLAHGAGLPAGTAVDEPAMARLFGTGHDPVTGVPLGRAHPAFTTAAERTAARVARLPGSLTREQRQTLTDQITAEEAAKPVRQAVAGFDLTFTAPKSVSVVWALADPVVQAEIAAAHHAAVADTLRLLETRVLFTRVGVGSCAQVATRGAIAAAFDHVDTRTGDPNLHTHLVLANKVQGGDGVWRSVDSRALYTAAVALSETYDSLLADHLTARLGAGWGWRDRGPNRSPAFEITGISEDLLSAFSTRAASITPQVAAMIEEHVAATERRPTRQQVLRIRQHATLATRPEKTPRSLAEQMATWRAHAIALGSEAGDVVRAALPQALRANTGVATGSATVPATQAPDAAAIAGLAGDVLAGLIERRSTWTAWNTLAETARATRHLRFPTAGERLAVHEQVVDAALAVCTRIDPAEPYTVPAAYRRPDGASVFTRAGTTRYTHPLVLAAEHRLLDAHHDLTAPTVPAPTEAPHATGEAKLAADQVDAVHAACTSGRRVEALVGPAGSGKTTTLRALRAQWERSRGHGSVIGLAPSATAARQLAASLGVPCENTAKWLHETHPATRARGGTWRMRPGQLIIVDEASLASTATLDALTRQARDGGAKLVLVGDHHQLGPVDAGGAFALLAEAGQPLELVSLWRFHRPWEADATRRLRVGDPRVVDVYQQQGRVHDGPQEAMVEAAYQAWLRDTTTGVRSVLLAADRATVALLNERARADRLTTGLVTGHGVQTRDGVHVGVGDRVVTRRNDRRLALPDGDHVRNGMLWDVTAIHDDASLTVTTTGRDGPARPGVRLPAKYAHRHLDLGYAVTVHRAQGITVDTGHTVVTPGTSREALYVAMTRGRYANHAYVPTDTHDPDLHIPDDARGALTGRQVLEALLAAPGIEPSATAAIRHAGVEAASPGRLRPVAATLAADITHRRWSRLLDQHLPPDLATALAADPVVGSVHAACGRAEAAGHDPAAILGQVTHAAVVHRHEPGDGGDLARRVRRHLGTWIDDTSPTVGVDPRDPLNATVVADPGDPAAQVLAEIRRLVDVRLAHHLTQRRPWTPEHSPDLAAPEPLAVLPDLVVAGPTP